MSTELDPVLVFAKDRPDFDSNGTSVMLCLSVARPVRKALARLGVDGAVDRREYHVTLIYFGKADDISRDDRLRLSLAAINVCREHAPLRMRIGGFGVFPPNESNDQKYVLYASVDALGLNELRTDLVRATESIVPGKKNHGFTPHLTLGYSGEEPDLPSVRDLPEWEATRVCLVVGESVVHFPLSGFQRAIFIDTLVKAHSGYTRRGPNGQVEYVAASDVPRLAQRHERDLYRRLQAAYPKKPHQTDQDYQLELNAATRIAGDAYTAARGYAHTDPGYDPATRAKGQGERHSHREMAKFSYRFGLAAAKLAKAVLFDLSKARPKGSRNAVHKYLLRLELPPGPNGEPRYFRVYPDPDDVDSFDPKRGYRLKNGKTVTQVINEQLFGDYGVDNKGQPWVKEGFLYTYKPQFTTAQFLKDRKLGESIDVKKLGKWCFFKFRRSTGYIGMDMGPGVDRQYTIPQKLKDFYLTDEAEIAEARAKVPGSPAGYTIAASKNRKGKLTGPATRVAGIQEGADDPKLVMLGAERGLPPGGDVYDVPPEGETNIHVVPKQSATTEAAISEPLSREIDPIDEAKTLLTGAKVKAARFPSWMTDKFQSEQDFTDRLQNEPATTLISLGRYNPKSMKIQNRLAEEWIGPIRGLAKRAFDAFKVTGMYDWYEKQGGEQGVREFRRQVMHDLMQIGHTALFNTANEYKATHEWDNRFDKLAYTVIKRTIWNESQKMISAYKEEGAYIPIVHEIDEEEAAYQAARKTPLTADEQFELETIAPKAQALLHRVLETLPVRERQLFFRRLWLDDPVGEVVARNAKKLGDSSGGPTVDEPVDIEDWAEDRKGHDWRRPFTGKHGVIPAGTATRGQQIKLREDARAAVSAARKRIIGSFSFVDEETGRKKLTREGRLVKRWLELEAKLSGGNRQLFTDRTLHRDILVHQPLTSIVPEKRTSERELLIPHQPVTTEGRPVSRPAPARTPVSPAVTFFHQNPKLARQLGLNLRAIDPTGHGGVHRTPHVANLGSFAEGQIALAERFHKLLTDAQGLTNEELTDRIAHLEGQKSGKVHNLDEFHTAVRDYSKHLYAKKEKIAEARRLRAEYKAYKPVVKLPETNPFDKDDPEARRAFKFIASKSPDNEEQFDAALTQYIHRQYPGEYEDHPKIFKKFHSGLKSHLVEWGNISIEKPKEALAAKLKTLAPTVEEEQSLKEAHDRVHGAGTVLSQHVGGTDVVREYLEALARGEPIGLQNPEVHRARLAAAHREVETELELLNHELIRRRTTAKSIRNTNDSLTGLRKALALW